MKKVLFLLITFSFFSCEKEIKKGAPKPPPAELEYKAADMSFLPLIESEGTIFKHENLAQDPLLTLKNAGCNTIRMRLWHNPVSGVTGFTEVKNFAARVKQMGMKVWLTVHYSDTWADPGRQTKPAAWEALSFADLKTAVATYTAQIVTEINPDIIQIGNETNDGMLWPDGKLSSNETQYLDIVNAASAAIRANSSTAKIMLHSAGLNTSTYFFNKVRNVDFDYIGLSYYPIWHGKSLSDLQAMMNTLGSTYNKPVVMAEISYPFTLDWNDYTNNIIGLENQLVPAYPATPIGQKNFVAEIVSMVKKNPKGIGFCYWGAEWIAHRGPTASNGSTWENQALWDFNNNSLPALEAFK